MELEDKKKMAFEWLLSEQSFTNERIAAYSESEQKIIGVMATVVAAILGLSFSKAGAVEDAHMPYILFLGSGLLSLAVLQSAVYSSLALLFMERKTKLSKRLEKFVGEAENFAHTAYSIFDLNKKEAYRAGVASYFAFKCGAGFILAVAGLVYSQTNLHSVEIWISFIMALTLALASMSATYSHLTEFKEFQAEMQVKIDNVEGG